jgi:hypothetical protein
MERSSPYTTDPSGFTGGSSPIESLTLDRNLPRAMSPIGALQRRTVYKTTAFEHCSTRSRVAAVFFQCYNGSSGPGVFKDSLDAGTSLMAGLPEDFRGRRTTSRCTLGVTPLDYALLVIATVLRIDLWLRGEEVEQAQGYGAC